MSCLKYHLPIAVIVLTVSMIAIFKVSPPNHPSNVLSSQSEQIQQVQPNISKETSIIPAIRNATTLTSNIACVVEIKEDGKAYITADKTTEEEILQKCIDYSNKLDASVKQFAVLYR